MALALRRLASAASTTAPCVVLPACIPALELTSPTYVHVGDFRVGIDFDNTLAGYDHVFVTVAKQFGLLPRRFQGDKRSVKENLMRNPLGEEQWMHLQGQVYGRFMQAAELLPGAREFLSLCRKHDIEIVIVSHKTQFGHYDDSRIDLQNAAMRWMDAQAGYQGDFDFIYFS